MKGLLCFVFILSTILIGCLFLNKDVEAFTPYRNEPSHYQTVYESNSSYQPSVDDVN